MAETRVVATTPFGDQKPGTSGLRKKATVFQQPHYTENFIQAILDAIPEAERVGGTLIVGGDGRFLVHETAELIVRMAAANGVARVVVGQNGLMSTPAVSAVVRKRKATGAIILTASHNPGGPDHDFGIKYNMGNGGPAPEAVTNAIFHLSKAIQAYKLVDVPAGTIDLAAVGESRVGALTLEVVDSVYDYVELMKQLFDFGALKAFIAGHPHFKFLFDGMSGAGRTTAAPVTGPYLRQIFVRELGLPESCLMDATPSVDFNGGHPDPNLTYAHALVERVHAESIDFGAAFDGDGDRNMIVSKNAFVNPSDSVAVIAANADAIPYFRRTGVKGVARSMPTSSALDRVAKRQGVPVYEVPTGWKFFGNLMDAGKLSICGEESFGTGSDHIREKDGIWAALAWLSILAHRAANGQAPSVSGVLHAHFQQFGRNFFTRYDYEEVASEGAEKMVAELRATAASGRLVGTVVKSGAESFTVAGMDDFAYTDPIDGSVSKQQGIRILFDDGSRLIFRLSGTGSVGATVRVYVERYEGDPAKTDRDPQEALKALAAIALEISQLTHFTGRTAPTVIT